MSQALVLAGIGVYRRYLSPRKGFACAHRVHLGGPSCSRVGERLIRRYGVLAGSRVLRERLARCAHVHRRLHASQRGSCDVPCDIPCDGSELRHLGDVCNCVDCGSCGGDRKKRDRGDR